MADIMKPNPGGGAPPMPGGPGTPIPPGQPGPGGTEVPGFSEFVQRALQSILSNPNASLRPEAVDGYMDLAILYARSYVAKMNQRP